MLIFDFDGVIVNSIDEITVTAHNVVTGRLDTALKIIPPRIIRLFQRNRFHVQGIGDVVTLMKWCMDQHSLDPDYIMPPSEYEILRKSARKPLADRTRSFFDTRKAFLDSDRERWLALNAPFSKIWNAFRNIQPDQIVILTTKNRSAVTELCSYFGHSLPETNIYSGDDGVLKIENMNAIHARFDDSPYVFIDDSMSNLKELDTHFNTAGETFIRMILAEWGYIGPGDAAMARESGYDVYSQERFVDYLIRAF